MFIVDWDVSDQNPKRKNRKSWKQGHGIDLRVSDEQKTTFKTTFLIPKMITTPKCYIPLERSWKVLQNCEEIIEFKVKGKKFWGREAKKWGEKKLQSQISRKSRHIASSDIVFFLCSLSQGISWTTPKMMHFCNLACRVDQIMLMFLNPRDHWRLPMAKFYIWLES
jgi:hypothetical protein